MQSLNPLSRAFVSLKWNTAPVPRSTLQLKESLVESAGIRELARLLGPVAVKVHRDAVVAQVHDGTVPERAVEHLVAQVERLERGLVDRAGPRGPVCSRGRCGRGLGRGLGRRRLAGLLGLVFCQVELSKKGTGN